MSFKRIFAVFGAVALIAVLAYTALDVSTVAHAVLVPDALHFNILTAMAAPPAAASLETLQKSVDDFMNGFEEFKRTNDENLQKRDVVLEDKLAKINTHLDKWEPLNQHLTKVQEGQKSMQDQLNQVEKILNRPRPGKEGQEEDAEYNAAFEHCLRRAPDRREAAHVDLLNKRRNTLVKGDDAGAGYLLAPPDVNREIIKDIIEMSPMRSLATVRTIGSESLKQPRRTATAGAARRVGEVEQRTNTGDPAYGMLTFAAPELFARAEISLQMLEDSDYDLIGELRSEFVDQFVVKENSEYVGGSASANQAEGFLVAPGIGETVSGDATGLKADGLINLWASLKTSYSSRAVFTLNRKTIAEARKLKTGDGQYLWVPGIAGSVPNTILGGNYVEFPDMPDIGAGTFPIAYGDFRRAYIIVDRVTLAFQPDYVTGADNGIVVFRARKRVGGGVRQAEALKKLKIAAA
ncbi:phage major capsid protein [Pararhizobium sp. BT-229]|uniref:phage major capsid protein n=1 Tax=Pararhizobium sp. BT-229 TaxID=2986923 RepID=UPI0021F7E3B5|nr:phage major capsid protein [Pararhizobium sp. BT-229]MCV9960740.1 phage major capsid protein [Pararhizobium sp. BT-229]